MAPRRVCGWRTRMAWVLLTASNPLKAVTVMVWVPEIAQVGVITLVNPPTCTTRLPFM